MRTLALSLLIVATASVSYAQVLWNVGRDDNTWNLSGTGGGPATAFVQEQGVINPLPGSPNNAPTVPPSQSADNDYYFSGIYNTVIPSVATFYGPYAPVGLVGSNEEAAERAFAGGDLDLRYHFNLPSNLTPADRLSVSFDALNLDDVGAPDPLNRRFGAEIYFNGILVRPQVVITPNDFDVDYASPFFTLASVNAVTGPGADNIVSLKGISYNGAVPSGGNWMGIDYVQLDAQVVPEPSTAMMLIFGAMGVAPLLRRRRA